MTDEADLAPEREAAVRRLLGAVGSEAGPALPPEVAERLDAALGDLVAERASADGPDQALAPVVHLSRRRRRAFAGLFVAAAAVVVAGIGIPLVHETPADRPTASSEAALSRTPADTAAVPSAGAAGGAHGTMNDRAQTMKLPRTESYNAASGAPVVVGKHHLRGDLTRLRRQVPADASYTSTTVHAPSGFTCATGRFGRGYLLGIRYAGAPAVVAFRAPAGTTQVAEVLQCGTATVLRSVTLPTP